MTFARQWDSDFPQMGKNESSKSQTPNPNEIPITKPQTKRQAATPVLGVWSLELLWGLGFGALVRFGLPVDGRPFAFHARSFVPKRTQGQHAEVVDQYAPGIGQEDQVIEAA